jgi:DNA helicase-2/ATP-dependent DNA helicase PcrA
MTYLDELNTHQYEAATTITGPLLVIAGAGAGKTKTITHRILHIINSGVAPRNILAVTFTNKAASEMRERVLSLMNKEGISNEEGLPTVATFHSLCATILRNESEAIGIKRHFVILDRTDSMKAIKEAMEKSGVSDKQFEPRTILGHISRQKGEGNTAQVYERNYGSEYVPGVIAKVWRNYEVILEREQALDFDDLLLKTMLLFSTRKDILSRYSSTWQYIHIDEYQDTNKVQFSIARLLASEHGNMCVVGDIDQNIYSWRGASIDNILDFEKEFPGAKVVTLEQNYRSTKTIVHISNKVIEKNLRRKKKVVFTENEDGEPISLFSAFDEQDEARFIAHTSKKLIEGGVSPSSIAVLYRANFQSRILEEAYLSSEVSYRVLGVKFFDRKEVKDVLSYVRASLNRDSHFDISRTANVPVRGIGKVTLIKMLAGQIDDLPPATKKKVADYYTLLDSIKTHASSDKPSETIKFVLDASGYLQSLEHTKKEEDLERAENLKELVTLAQKYDDLSPLQGIEALLEYAALESDQDKLEQKEKAVTLMTVHAAKGLEFDYVFIAGLEDGLFPHERMGDSGVDNEEERRLFYVAVTRAAKKIYLTHAATRTIYGTKQVNLPSEFLADIDEEFLVAEERPDGFSRVIYLD